MKALSLFSGIGAFEKALRNLNIDYELVNYCEIDKYAARAYAAIHGVSENKNLGDITKIDERKLKDFDLVTYGFPCQDISVAGKQKGVALGTRSGLLYDAMRIIQRKMPKYAIAENVKNLVGKGHIENFKEFLAELEFYGYNSYWKVLNAKDYGIPQNRERVFIISIRKDIDKKDFEWPLPFDNGLRLIDFLEDEVDEKYYLSQEKTEKLISEYKNQIQVREATKRGYAVAEIGDSINLEQPNSQTRRGRVGKEVAQTLTCSCNQAAVIPFDKEYSNTIRSGGRGSTYRHQWDMVAVPVITPDMVNKKQNGRRFKEDGEPMFTLTAQDRHGILKCHESLRETTDQIATCIDANYHKGLDNHGQRTGVLETSELSYRIRKLTPKECFRLMGFTNSDFDKVKAAEISDSQCYKMAGNSIVVNVLEEIFKNLFREE